MPSASLQTARLVALATPLALLGGAYMGQYVFGLYPCEMCWWQRYPLFAAIAFALLAWLRPPGRAFVILAGMAIAISGLIGGFHAGVEYGWWPGLTACASNVMAGSDPLEAILNAPITRCDVAPWSLFGISLAGWNFLVSGAAAILIFTALSGDRR